MTPWDIQTLTNIIYFYPSPLLLNAQFLHQQLKIICIPHPETLIYSSQKKKIVFL